MPKRETDRLRLGALSSIEEQRQMTRATFPSFRGVVGLAVGASMAAAICLVTGSAAGAQTSTQAPPQGQEAGKQQYTMAEYNSYQAAAAEKNPTQQIKLLAPALNAFRMAAPSMSVAPAISR